MSRDSAAKKARRKKRKGTREANWITETDGSGQSPEEEFDELTQAVSDINEWMVGRGWVFDTEVAEEMVSWLYPPSEAEVDAEDAEPMSRVWIAVDEDDDEVALVFGAMLVGSGDDGTGVYVIEPDRLADGVAALEAYRHGGEPPASDSGLIPVDVD
ncbi:MAG: hypothetical protein ACR2JM_01090 [Mycobacterium sp.]